MAEVMEDTTHTATTDHFTSIRLDLGKREYTIKSGLMENNECIRPITSQTVSLDQITNVNLPGWHNSITAWEWILSYVKDIRDQVQNARRSKKRVYAYFAKGSLAVNPSFLYDYHVGRVIVNADIWFKNYLTATIPEATLNNYPGSFWLFPSALFGDHCVADPGTFYAFDFQLEVRYLGVGNDSEATDIFAMLVESVPEIEDDDNLQGLLQTTNQYLKDAMHDPDRFPELIALRDAYIAYMYVISPKSRQVNQVLESSLFSSSNWINQARPPMQAFRETERVAHGGILFTHNGDIEVDAILLESQSIAAATSDTMTEEELIIAESSDMIHYRVIRNAQKRLTHEALPDGYQMHHLPVNIVISPIMTDYEIDQKLLEVCSQQYYEQLLDQELANYQSALDEYSTKLSVYSSITTTSDTKRKSDEIKSKALMTYQSSMVDLFDSKLKTILEERPYMQRPVDDIDSRDAGNPLLVSSYVNDMYKHFSIVERQYVVNPDYMKKQGYINEKMRCILVDWLVCSRMSARYTILRCSLIGGSSFEVQDGT
jgi:hypothetical protein